MTTRTIESLPVAVIGAGPVGLAAAAHLLEQGLEPLVLEAGEEVAANVARWGHVRVFSPWSAVIDQAAARLLRETPWEEPDMAGYPTGTELRDGYLRPLAAVAELSGRVRVGHRVVAVTRRHHDKLRDRGREDAPFELVVESARGRERVLARAVIDASGSFATPNPLGASGVPADGEAEHLDTIAYGVPHVRAERARYAGRHVLVVGAGHSAMNVLADLVSLKRDDPATRITWAIRRESAAALYGSESDGLPERSALGRATAALVDTGLVELVHGVEVTAVSSDDGGVYVDHRTGRLGPFDEIVAATGFRPNLSIASELRLGLDPVVEAPVAIAPLIDPNVHSCGTVRPHGAQELAHPEPGFYVAGMKSYGRAPTFLMLTGYEQVRSIAARLAGDDEAAARVELVLPETGVCSGSGGLPQLATAVVGAACC